ncbi:unnamed protein product [Caenorhabditis angaria]|uniref:Uncharacterized protein n=1 Tax=Caenorhabditis angaria TaxID=860376 RepID=A0A9P1MZY9_9PELO|nr:unnamed protein product [Caenorhabditis angaria]
MSAIAKEDIYESEGSADQSKNLTIHEKDAQNHPDIEVVSVDIDDALNKFKGRVLNLKAADYSDSIARKRRNAFGNNQYVLEVVGSGYNGHETTNEKLNRILYEIADLNEQLKTSEGKKEENEFLNEQVLENLASEVKNLQKTPKSGEKSYEEVDLPRSVPFDAKSNALEKRLRRIEKVLGAQDEKSAPILDILEDLKLRCETLNSGYVTGLEQRLNVVLTKLEKIEEIRANNSIDETSEQKVNEILEIMQRWDISCSSLPSNVNKVKALNRLHEQAQHFASNLSQLKTIREKLEKEASQGREAIREFETAGKQEMSQVVEKLKLLEKQVADLK